MRSAGARKLREFTAEGISNTKMAIYHARDRISDIITADRKILNEEGESQLQCRYAVVLQDLASQWLQSYPCATKTSQETMTSLRKFLEPEEDPKVAHTDNSSEIVKACEDLNLESLYVDTTPIREQ